MKTTKIVSSLSLGIALACGSVSFAAVTLVSYDFEDSSARTDPDFTNISITASSLTYGTMVNTGASYLTSGDNTVLRIRTSELPASTTYSTNYIQITINAVSGYTFNLSSISIDGSISASGLYGYVRLRTDLDNYGANIAGGSTQFTSTSTSTKELDLSSVSSLTDLSSLTLRLFVMQANGSTTRYFAMDNITLTGTVTAVPEPATSALFLSVAGMALLIFARLRKIKRT
ncbi:PEP-CTERM sorting domain-containing protein [Opitutaceae bacterium TAV4]|nr:PEP-CTERM sorting domain-containing protein [Opitutaceae bacterium TAV4]RRJ98428.1 PEP-CTERM sorting domain-containing protein [Opitutaceae bacterium TAV3]